MRWLRLIVSFWSRRSPRPAKSAPPVEEAPSTPADVADGPPAHWLALFHKGSSAIAEDKAKSVSERATSQRSQARSFGRRGNTVASSTPPTKTDAGVGKATGQDVSDPGVAARPGDVSPDVLPARWKSMPGPDRAARWSALDSMTPNRLPEPDSKNARAEAARVSKTISTSAAVQDGDDSPLSRRLAPDLPEPAGTTERGVEAATPPRQPPGGPVTDRPSAHTSSHRHRQSGRTGPDPQRLQESIDGAGDGPGPDRRSALPESPSSGAVDSEPSRARTGVNERREPRGTEPGARLSSEPQLTDGPVPGPRQRSDPDVSTGADALVKARPEAISRPRRVDVIATETFDSGVEADPSTVGVCLVSRAAAARRRSIDEDPSLEEIDFSATPSAGQHAREGWPIEAADWQKVAAETPPGPGTDTRRSRRNAVAHPVDFPPASGRDAQVKPAAPSLSVAHATDSKPSLVGEERRAGQHRSRSVPLWPSLPSSHERQLKETPQDTGPSALYLERGDWPELPPTSVSERPDLSGSRGALAAWRKRRRLDREQRGVRWSE